MKTKITNVSYGRTLNMGNFESVRIVLTAAVRETEDWEDVLEDLKGEMLKLDFSRGLDSQKPSFPETWLDYDFQQF